MNPFKPRVSIGVPVYNGERYLRAGLDSLLAQTFTDFEIIISDNASTDSTEQICQEYAQRDRRIRYFRNETNLGPTANYAKLVELAQGDYFKWHNYDDTCAPEFLARCVEVLNQHPDVILCHPRMNGIDSQGQLTEAYVYDLHADEPSIPHRFGNIICVDHRRHAASELFGLMRRSTVQQLPPQGKYARADSVFLARLALFGRFYEVPEVLFFNREHENRSSRVTSITIRSRTQVAKWLGVGPLPPTEWFDASKQGKITMPEWNLVKQYWNSIWLPPLSVSDRMGCCGVFAYWLMGHIPKLLRDVLIAGEVILRSRLIVGGGQLTPRKLG